MKPQRFESPTGHALHILGVAGLSLFLACSGASTGTDSNAVDEDDASSTVKKDSGSHSGKGGSSSGDTDDTDASGDDDDSGDTSGSSTGSSSTGSKKDAGSSSGSSSGGTSTGGTTPTMLPTAKGSCPTLKSGANTITVNGKGMPWTLWVGSKVTTGSGGPIIIYWHGTGTNGSEATTGLSQAAISEVQSMGGVVASAESTSSTGTNTGDNVWYTGDFDYSDEIIACAIKQLNIDTRHIHSAGYSAGALQTATMFYSRSGYLASVTVYSGGAAFPAAAQDASNHIPVLGAHGSTSGDFLASSTTSWETTVKGKGSFVIDCDDGGSHVDITRLSRLGPSAWQFFKDHPFKIGTPDPYKAVPSGFPSYCKLI